MGLYTGDYKQFSDLTCPNCQNLAIEPKDCANCGEQICKPCFSGKAAASRAASRENGDDAVRQCGSCRHPFGPDCKNTGKAVQGMLRNATFSCVYECGKMYLPLHKMETHLEDCRERFIECPKADCKKAVKHSELDKHNEESHPIKAILDCKECNANFFEGEKHSCVSYVIALLK